MANTVVTPSIVAAESLRILKNNLVLANKVHRAHESEFKNRVNGYKPGTSITIRRPTDYTVRDGAVMNIQDAVEGTTTLTVNKQKGVDLKFTSEDMTLEVSEFSKRFIEPAVVQLANQVDVDLMSLYDDVPNWVGTPGQTINSFSDFGKGPQRLDEYAVPMEDRCAVLSPADMWGLLGAQTALYMQDVAKDAYRMAKLGMIGGVDTYMCQNVQTHTCGSRSGSILIDGSITTSTTDYATEKDDMLQTIHVDALGGATQTFKAGDVITIADVYAVNPVTKAALPDLKQFVVTADATAASSEVDLIIYPAMIWSGAQQNVSVTSSVTDLDDQAVTVVGTASTGYAQNMVFHKNAFALAMVPMEKPDGAVNVQRKSSDGFSIRLIPVYDGVNDVSSWRLDILYGVLALDPRLATRLSGTA